MPFYEIHRSGVCGGEGCRGYLCFLEIYGYSKISKNFALCYLENIIRTGTMFVVTGKRKVHEKLKTPTGEPLCTMCTYVYCK
jgi:hypothetical protein